MYQEMQSITGTYGCGVPNLAPSEAQQIRAATTNPSTHRQKVSYNEDLNVYRSQMYLITAKP